MLSSRLTKFMDQKDEGTSKPSTLEAALTKMLGIDINVFKETISSVQTGIATTIENQNLILQNSDEIKQNQEKILMLLENKND